MNYNSLQSPSADEMTLNVNDRTDLLEFTVIAEGTCHKDMDASLCVTICDPCNLFRGTCRSLSKVVSVRGAFTLL